MGDLYNFFTRDLVMVFFIGIGILFFVVVINNHVKTLKPAQQMVNLTLMDNRSVDCFDKFDAKQSKGDLFHASQIQAFNCDGVIYKAEDVFGYKHVYRCNSSEEWRPVGLVVPGC